MVSEPHAERRRGVDRRRGNGHLTIEDWLYARNIDWLEKLYLWVQKVKSLLKLMVFLAVVLLVVAVGLEVQVQRRNNQFDQIRDDVEEVRDFTREIARTPDDPQFNILVKQGLDKLNTLCAKVKCEEEK
jgi:hypothetical protein